MYNDTEYEYFKVSVLNGTKLVKGAVPNTCKLGIHIFCCVWKICFLLFLVDMKAVCSGPTDCQFTDENCVITPLSSNCHNPM